MLNTSAEITAGLPVSIAEAPERESRKPQLRPHLDNLDVLRGLAIFAVLLFHSIDSVWGPGWLDTSNPIKNLTLDFNRGTSFWLYPFHTGHLGVAIFFGVSGFCIHLSAMRGASGAPGVDFFVRRFFRIVPAYFVVLLVLASHRVHWHEVATVKSFLAHLFFVHNFSSATIYSINPSFWSIAIEVQLYALYPIVWICAARIGWRNTLLLTLVIEVALRITQTVMEGLHQVYLPAWLSGSPFYYWFSWTVGAYAAENFLHNEAIPRARVTAGWLILLGVIADGWFVSSQLSFPLVAAGTALLVSGQPLLSSRWSKWLMILGAWSYSLYLIHQPLLQKVGDIAGNKFERSNFLPLLGVLVAAFVIVLLSGILYRLLEKPSIEAGHWVRAKLRLTAN